MLVTDVLASTGNILEVVVTLVVNITTGLTMTNTILGTLERCASVMLTELVSEAATRTALPWGWPGVHFLERLYSVQVGMRHFNIRKNKYHCPIVNLDKLWSLVGTEVGRVCTPLYCKPLFWWQCQQNCASRSVMCTATDTVALNSLHSAKVHMVMMLAFAGEGEGSR